jgi:hypothetical protein
MGFFLNYKIETQKYVFKIIDPLQRTLLKTFRARFPVFSALVVSTGL